MPVTARSLETMIRLSSAHAKSRLSTEVAVEDVVAAYEVVKFALYNSAGFTFVPGHRAGKVAGRGAGRGGGNDGDDGGDGGGGDGGDGAGGRSDDEID